MSDQRTYPYTPDDLRRIADRIDEITTTIGAEDLTEGGWRWGLTVDIYDDEDNLVGQLRPAATGWLGFYPKEVHE